MTGPTDSGAIRLEPYRSYLLLLARMTLDSGLDGKIDASDVVQQTLLEAFARREKLPPSADELCRWLRAALANNIRDQRKYLRRQKRDVGRQRSLEAVLAASSQSLARHAAVVQSSPSRQAIRAEEMLRLANLLCQLPQAQREAIVLHHLQGKTLSQIARQLGKSDAAVAGLLHRGLLKLRTLLDSSA